MRSGLRQMMLAAMLLALTACAGAPPIVASPSACSALLPEAWRVPVKGAPLPTSEALAEWIVFGDAQTARLDQANDRTVTAIGIIDRCEARDQAAIAKARRKWWQFWR